MHCAGKRKSNLYSLSEIISGATESVAAGFLISICAFAKKATVLNIKMANIFFMTCLFAVKI